MAGKITPTHQFLLEIADELSSGEVCFPTFFEATLKIRTALNDAGISADALSRIVMREPLLAAKVVRLANSAALNPAGSEIVDLKAAVIRVGFGPIRTLAIALAMEQLIQAKELRGHERMARGFWDRCVDVAAQSFMLARKLTRINPDEAMFAGVVHNIGSFYLLARLCGRSELATTEQELERMIDAWQVNIGHAVLSALDLPEPIVTAVGNQDEPFDGDTPSTLAQILYTAIRLSTHETISSTPEQRSGDGKLLNVAARMASTRDERASLVSALSH